MSNKHMSMVVIVSALLGALVLGAPAFSAEAGGPLVSGMIRSGEGRVEITDVKALADGRIVMCGWMEVPVAWPAPGWNHEHAGGSDGFVAIVSKNLEELEAFTLIGGGSDDQPTALTTDSKGNIYVVGWTISNNFPTSANSIGYLYSSATDGFVVGFTPFLDSLLFGSYIRGNRDEFPTDVQVDAASTIYICGSTNSNSGFPNTNGIFKTPFGGRDAFVMRLGANATSVLFSTYFGGTGDDTFNGMLVHTNGAIYLAGSTSSVDYKTFPVINPSTWWQYSERPYDWTFNGGITDATLVILSDDGARAIASTYLGGSANDAAMDVAVIDSNIILVGSTQSPDFPVASPVQNHLRGSSDAFISRFTQLGQSLPSSTYYGGYGDEVGTCVHIYPPGQYAIAGVTTSSDFPNVGIGTSGDRQGAHDGFVLFSNISSASFATTLGGTDTDSMYAMAVQPDRGVVVAGWSRSSVIELSPYALESNPIGVSACAIRIQPGSVSLIDPVGDQRYCEGSTMRATWLGTEMLTSDRYTLEASADGIVWTELVSDINAQRVDWVVSPVVELGQRYFIRIRSSRGHTSRTDTPLWLDPKPMITKTLPVEVSICPGGKTVLRGNATGVGISYRWLASGSEISGEIEDSLEVGHGTPYGAGDYQMRYRALCGVNGIVGTTKVTDGIPTEIEAHPQNVVASIGGSATFSVQATGSRLQYQWFRNNSLIEGATQRAYTVASVSSASAGQYTCKVVGDCGEVTSRPGTLVVSATGVHNNEGTPLRVFPNPTSGTVTISLRTSDGAVSEQSYPRTLTLLNSIGQEVLSLRIPDGQADITFDIGDLSPGLYLICPVSQSRNRMIDGLQLIVR